MPTAGRSSSASDGSGLVWLQILLVPGAKLMLHPLGHGSRGRSGPACPVPALQGHPWHSHSLPVSLQLQQPLELQGSSFPCRAGVPQGFQAASELSCPVRYVESIQDGHLLALKQSSASSKISLPCSGCLLLKRYRHVLAVKERGGWGNHCCCCH